MSFPAYQDLDRQVRQAGENIRRGFRRWLVYRYLADDLPLDFVDPVDVKATALATTLRMSPRNVIEALDWLVENGYLCQTRKARRVRSLRLFRNRKPRQAA